MKIAVVGGGISGLTSLYLLHHHSSHQVEILEKQDTFGGDAHTVLFQPDPQNRAMKNVGQILFNRSGWPNFVRFLDHLSVSVVKSAKSISITDQTGYSWGSTNLGALFSTWSNIFKWRTWSMIFDIFRFHYSALQVLGSPKANMTVGKWLAEERYGDAFRDDYLLPFVGALWSVPPDKVSSDFPIGILIQAWHNQKLLQLFDKDEYLTIEGGSKKYIDKITQSVPSSAVHSNTTVISVNPTENGVILTLITGQQKHFDHVIFAIHPHVVTRLLTEGMSVKLRNALNGIEYSKFDIWLHYDDSARPKNHKVWAAWNMFTGFHLTPKDITPSSCTPVTFDLNRLQNLPRNRYGSVLGTLNPVFEIDPKKIIARRTYEMPVVSLAQRRAADLLAENHPAIHLHPRLTITGAWQGYGFHEDGFISGYLSAVRLGASPPFQLVSSDRSVEISLWDRMVSDILEGVQCIRMSLEKYHSNVWTMSLSPKWKLA
ncbi:hypothetical protein TREMEDRAFT_29212 [Tremella mesenterica DSM 1558]|uniref:uncharacterized protein n=1 Tax=Tremella mesenterica (strain ATCC 24925 / CBS 8224 / DSM 1558 / NBRC 9311 / NRRL Y-6157 / RJB 2259-6 / UBC 559-6) TaxID=578456 RepID=UPI0003F48C0F|nr:uncharacterized protein TREMEDRAFT_29212 [Tremella mesenterica DSM 1558]EIW70497.1 hypothetical protein TREMEDRAFT_29212 [Tremella mesenterica DSM 1558]